MSNNLDLTELEQQKEQLQNKINSIKEDNFKQASKNWFTLLHAQYESSSSRTNQYITFCRVFKRQFKKLLNETFDIEKIEISRANHFDQTGFFELSNGRTYYFSIGDLRWNKCFMIRTAINFEDYTGGINQNCSVEDYESFISDLKSIVDNSEDKELYGFGHKACQTSILMSTKKEARKLNCQKCKKPFLEEET